jgi:hypothetical protein
MGIPDVGKMSLGEYAAESRGWAKAHGTAQEAPPSEDEFDRAVMRVRGSV